MTAREILVFALPPLLLVVGTPHLAQAVRKGWWRILYLGLIAGLAVFLWANPQPGSYLTSTDSWFPYFLILAVAALALFAHGYRLFAFGLALTIGSYGNDLRPYINLPSLTRLTLVLAAVSLSCYLVLLIRRRKGNQVAEQA